MRFYATNKREIQHTQTNIGQRSHILFTSGILQFNSKLILSRNTRSGFQSGGLARNCRVYAETMTFSYHNKNECCDYNCYEIILKFVYGVTISMVEENIHHLVN